MSGNGALDLFIGAPGVNDDRGEAYVFYGPFEIPPGQTELLLEADDADVILTSFFDDDEGFGRRVSPLHDITGDGRPELRIQSRFTDAAGTQYGITQVYSSGSLLGGDDPLFGIVHELCDIDLWPPLPGDVFGDLFVGIADLNRLLSNLGLQGLNLTTFDGDLVADGHVDYLDLAVLLEQFGESGMLSCLGLNLPGGPGDPGPNIFTSEMLTMNFAEQQWYAATPSAIPIGGGLLLDPIAEPIPGLCLSCGRYGLSSEGWCECAICVADECHASCDPECNENCTEEYDPDHPKCQDDGDDDDGGAPKIRLRRVTFTGGYTVR